MRVRVEGGARALEQGLCRGQPRVERVACLRELVEVRGAGRHLVEHLSARLVARDLDGRQVRLARARLRVRG